VKQYKQGLFFSDNFVGENSWNGYERNCLFANVGYVPPAGAEKADQAETRQFMDVARPTGSDCIKDSRGVAVADFNGDGKLDLVINNNNAAPTLYLNDVKKDTNSLVIKLKGSMKDSSGTPLSTDAIGAQVRVTIAGKTMMRQVEAGSGFASEMMLPIHFGLGDARELAGVQIKWPDGQIQRLDGAQTGGWVNSQVHIKEGSSTAIEVIPNRPLSRAAASSGNKDTPPVKGTR
jgi:hypothetical protein